MFATITPSQASDIRSELFVAGEVLPPRSLVNNHSIGAGPLAVQRLHLSYFKSKRSETISNLSLMTGATAAAATPTLVRFGIYSVDSLGNLTLVASTPNDVTLFAATFTLYTKALSTTWTKLLGQEYALGLLIDSPAALPALAGLLFVGTSLIGVELSARTPMVNGWVAGQADLPSAVATGSVIQVGGSGAVFYWRMS